MACAARTIGERHHRERRRDPPFPASAVPRPRAEIPTTLRAPRFFIAAQAGRVKSR